jgi:hypothetical protein
MTNEITAYIIQNEINSLLLRTKCLPHNEEFQRVIDSLGAALGSMSRGIRIIQAQEARAA